MKLLSSDVCLASCCHSSLVSISLFVFPRSRLSVCVFCATLSVITLSDLVSVIFCLFPAWLLYDYEGYVRLVLRASLLFCLYNVFPIHF